MSDCKVIAFQGRSATSVIEILEAVLEEAKTNPQHYDSCAVYLGGRKSHGTLYCAQSAPELLGRLDMLKAEILQQIDLSGSFDSGDDKSS